MDVTTPEGIDIVHSLAQAAHCLAQGKVGSGFDVASAVYGTHVYRRFSPAVLEPLFAEFERGEKGDAVYNVVHTGKWDQEARPLRLPRGLRLMLADVDAGTDTPSFVGRVLKWRKENPEEGESMFRPVTWWRCDRVAWCGTVILRACRGSRTPRRILASDAPATTEVETTPFPSIALFPMLTAALAQWTALDEANRSLEQALAALIELESLPEYDAELKAAGRSRVGDVGPFGVANLHQLKPGRVSSALQTLAAAIEAIRAGMRTMSASSQVPIEPPEQTRLLDACSVLPGVLGGGVPGGKLNECAQLNQSWRIRCRLVPRSRRRFHRRQCAGRVGRVDRDERVPLVEQTERRGSRSSWVF